MVFNYYCLQSKSTNHVELKVMLPDHSIVTVKVKKSHNTEQVYQVGVFIFTIKFVYLLVCYAQDYVLFENLCLRG